MLRAIPSKLVKVLFYRLLVLVCLCVLFLKFFTCLFAGEVDDGGNNISENITELPDEISENITENPEEISEESTNSDPEHKCKKCDRAFKSDWHLKRHEKVHLKESVGRKPTRSGEKSFVCTFESCLKQFPDQWKLNKHEATHSKEQSSMVFYRNLKSNEKIVNDKFFWLFNSQADGPPSSEIQEQEGDHAGNEPCNCSSKGCLKRFAMQRKSKSRLRNAKKRKVSESALFMEK